MPRDSKKPSSERRKDSRSRENKRIAWRVENSDACGHGRVRDMSASGMLLEITSPVRLVEQSLFSFDPAPQKDGCIPSSGRLAWQMKKRYLRNQYLCGIQFTDTPPGAARLSSVSRKDAQRLADRDQFQKNFNLSLFVVVAGLTGYMLYLNYEIYRDVVHFYDQMFRISAQQAAMIKNYQRLARETSFKLQDVTQQLDSTIRLYAESQVMLRAAARELDVTRTVLSETETMLSLASQENLQLKQEIESGRTFRSRDARLADEVKVFQNQLTDYGGDFRSVQEGSVLIDSYRQKIRDARLRIRRIRREAWSARVEALQERDRVRLMLGNNGYFFRDGQIVTVDMEQYHSASVVDSPSAAASSPPDPRKARIDVTVFQK